MEFLAVVHKKSHCKSAQIIVVFNLDTYISGSEQKFAGLTKSNYIPKIAVIDFEDTYC